MRSSPRSGDSARRLAPIISTSRPTSLQRPRASPTAPLRWAPYWQDSIHSLKGLPHVIDIRNIGLIGAIEFDPIPDAPSQRAHARFVEAFNRGLLVRATGDTIALSPPLIVEKKEIDQLIDILGSVLKTAN